MKDATKHEVKRIGFYELCGRDEAINFCNFVERFGGQVIGVSDKTNPTSITNYTVTFRCGKDTVFSYQALIDWYDALKQGGIEGDQDNIKLTADIIDTCDNCQQKIKELEYERDVAKQSLRNARNFMKLLQRAYDKSLEIHSITSVMHQLMRTPQPWMEDDE